MRAVFTGFDSAWGAGNKGAICELVLREDGALWLRKDYPIAASWNEAIDLVGRTEDAELRIWAVDQPLCVVNESGCRPVEADLARALMKEFDCGAYPSNVSNPCWTSGARIWDLLRELVANGYRHNPMAIPEAEDGRHYFECYPHPAVIGLFDLDHILKYKVGRRDVLAWQQLLELLQSLASADLPIANIDSFVTGLLAQNKDNENKLDAIICAYVAAYWWKYGTKRSTMIGDVNTGYVVTPHSDRTQLALARVFRGRMNMRGDACTPPHAKKHSAAVPWPPRNRVPAAASLPVEGLPVEPSNDWTGPVTLRATDTSNLWRTSRGDVINSWMDANRMVGWRLWVRFFEEDGEPAVLFVPFDNQGRQQGGMKTAIQQMNRQLWHLLVSEATRGNPIDFRILYRYDSIWE